MIHCGRIFSNQYFEYRLSASRKHCDTPNLFCRNGFGMVIAANRFAGIRCGLGFEVEAVRKGRIDDDINSLSIPSDYVDEVSVRRMIEIFLKEERSSFAEARKSMDKCCRGIAVTHHKNLTGSVLANMNS